MEVTVICCNQFNLPLSRISRQVIILTRLGEGDVIFTLQSSVFLPDSASFTGEIDIEVMFQWFKQYRMGFAQEKNHK